MVQVPTCAYVCVCVCVRERERERGKRSNRNLRRHGCDMRHQANDVAMDVRGALIGLEELGVRQPGFHSRHAALDGARVTVALGNHPLEHDDVGLEVLGDGLGVHGDGAACG